MPVRRTRRLPRPDRDRALALLASCRDGCPEALMVAHGFTAALLAELMRDGAATGAAAPRPRSDLGLLISLSYWLYPVEYLSDS